MPRLRACDWSTFWFLEAMKPSTVNSTKPTNSWPKYHYIGPCHVSGIFLPLRVNSLPLATIYEVKIPLRKWKKSLLQRNPAQMTWANVYLYIAIRHSPQLCTSSTYTASS
jgi:hypothetical protein